VIHHETLCDRRTIEEWAKAMFEALVERVGGKCRWFEPPAVDTATMNGTGEVTVFVSDDSFGLPECASWLELLVDFKRILREFYPDRFTAEELT
jgi:hypothetical protein